MQKLLDAIIGENQSVATKNNTTHISTIQDVIDVSHKLNSNLA